MNIISPIVPATDTLAWRISLSPTGGKAAGPGKTSIEELIVESVLSGAGEQRPSSIEVVWVGLGKGISAETERSIEAWVEQTAGNALVRASVRTIRVIWSERRAAFFGPAESVTDVLDALSRFTVLAWKTANLEAELEATWPDIDSQSRLTQANTRFTRKNLRDIQKVTEQVNTMNSVMLRIDPEIDQLDPKLMALSKRLFAELSAQANIEDRLDLLEEPIDHAFEQCELLNERIIESRHASSSHRLETLIVVLLVLEVLLSSYYFFGQSVTLASAQEFIAQFSI